jgi:hypothetical protein
LGKIPIPHFEEPTVSGQSIYPLGESLGQLLKKEIVANRVGMPHGTYRASGA